MGYEIGVNKALREVERVARQDMDIRLTPLQRRAIESVLAGRDTMLISQTGSGKSAVYQLAGALLEGTTIVVSPLIALQEDQRARFDEMDIGNAVAINSLHGRRHRADVLQQVASGKAEFALLGPEQLRTADVHEVLSSLHIDWYIVDESLCIDSCGRYLRPCYPPHYYIRASLGNPPVLA